MVAIRSLVLAGLFGSSVLAQYTGCYAPDGKTKADAELIVPCNKLGIYQAGVESSCCRLDGAESERDVCTTAGLCKNNNNVLRRQYCTDKTWKSAACVNICTDSANGGNSTGASILTACDDGSGKYCCGDKNLACCGSDSAISLPTQQASVVNGENADQAKAFKNATIALAVIVGVLVIASGAAIAWLTKKLKTVKKQLVEKNNEVANAPPPPMIQEPYQDTYQESNYPGSPGSKNSSVPASPGIGTYEMNNNMARYSELDAHSAARSEMGSPVPQSDHGLGSPRSMNSYPHSPHHTS